MKAVYVAGSFDNPGPEDIRLLQEASRYGSLTLLLSSDASIECKTGKPPLMSFAERRYFFEGIRFVEHVREAPENLAAAGITTFDMSGIVPRDFYYDAPPVTAPKPPEVKRVVVTGCFDFFHTGHMRFFEEASEYGELNVIIGSDANVRLLKGEGHPLFPQEQRRFIVGACRYVTRCLVSTGSGWLDAEPEIKALRAERYIVNEDGDKPEKRKFCEMNGIEYIVLKRTPKPGLPRRSSTDLRGF